MIRKITLLAVAAMAILAVSAGTASANHVTVENPGTYEAESEVDLGIYAHFMGVEVPQLVCDNHWDLTVNSDGSGTIDAEGIFEHPAASGNCHAEPCNAHDVWPFQIEEDEVNGGFTGHVVFCLENTGTGLSGIPFPVECAVNSVEAHCDQQIATSPQGLPIEVEGELDFHGDLGLMHG